MIPRILSMIRSAERVLTIGLLAALVAVVFAGTVGRYVGYPVVWSDEVAQALFVWVSLLAADMTLQRSGHFSVDIFANLLPRRPRLVLDLAILVLIGALLTLLFVAAFSFARMTSMRPLPMLGVPASFATAALPVGFALMLVTIVEQFIRRLRAAPSPDRIPPSEIM